MDAIYDVQAKLKADRGLSKVKIIHNHNYKRHGTKSYVSLMKRWGFQPTKEGPYYHAERPSHVGTKRVLVKKAGAEQDPDDGQVTAEDQQNDSMYLCKVQIGNPPQSLMLDFDTGSADTWVRSTSQSGHNIFHPKSSKTFKKLSGKTWKIEYGDGSSASGTCGTDVLVLGGLTVHNQTIECATRMSRDFEENTGDGLLGLAWSTINTVRDAGEPDPQATPVENMIKQKAVPREAELFTSCFYSTRDQGAGDGPKDSFYTFGFIDQDLVKQSGADIHWTDVDSSQGFWSVPSASASVGGHSVSAPDRNTAIADTGTSLTLLSDRVVEALYREVPGARYDDANQGYVFPVGTAADDLPDFKVAVGDAEFTIQKEDLAFAPTDDGADWYGGVQSRGDMSFDLLGDVFLKSCYCIWDLGNKRLGLVPKIEETQNLTPTPDDSGGVDGEKIKVLSTDLVGSG